MELARYTFGSLVRRGFQADADAQAMVTVTVNDGEPDHHRVPMLVAGDVTGIPPRQVIRSYPRDGVTNAEPNYLALVEFDAPELPWLFSRPVPGGPTRPWIALVVIDETELEDDPLAATPLGTSLEIDASQLPDPAESYLWAHVQLLDSDTVPGDPARSLARLLSPRRLHPDRHYLACVVPTLKSAQMAGLDKGPGELRTSADLAWKKTDSGPVILPVYHWFRFATGPSGDFETLVRRLQGVELPDDVGTRHVRLDHPLSGLPASTPEVADAELHVALRPLTADTPPIASLVGQSYVDRLQERLADAGYDISLITRRPGPPPEVGPPVYGQLPVGPMAKAASLGTALVPPWLTDLNLDPRHRIAAGLGAQVVQRNQDHYLGSAWRQVGDVLAANRLRRRAEYSMAASRRVYERVISRLDDGDLVTITAPVHAKIEIGPQQTIVGRLRASAIPPSVVSVEFRRFSRSRGALAHGSDWQASLNVPQLAARSADAMPLTTRVPLDGVETLAQPSTIFDHVDSLEVLRRLVTDVGEISPAEAAATLDKVAAPPTFSIPAGADVRSALAASPPPVDRVLSVAGFVPPSVLEASPRPPADRPPTRVAGRFGGILRSGVEVLLRRSPGPFRRWMKEPVILAPEPDRIVFEQPGAWMRNAAGDVSVQIVRDEPSLLRVQHGEMSVDIDRLNVMARTGPGVTTIDRAGLESAAAGTYRPPPAKDRDFGLGDARRAAVAAEISAVAERIADRVIRPGDVAQPDYQVLTGGFSGLRSAILGALDPRESLPVAVNAHIRALEDAEAGTLSDIMAAPDLSEPTYSRLAEISHDWLLPGIDRLPPDTTTLVAANREFIEAFLIGMNHELARELLWHEYPTDQRGTYARQFWSRRATATRDEQFDLRLALHEAPDLHLGGLGRTGKDPLVLVVKGELIRRYPNVIICLAQTKAGPRVRQLDESRMRKPDFFGTLEPDVALVGFDEPNEDDIRAAAADEDEDEAWWFFFSEHFTEPRFGFDERAPDSVPNEPGSWNDAAWQHAAPGDFLTSKSFDLLALPKGPDAQGAPVHKWAENAAIQAWITLQFPFRRGIRAIDLLPPKDKP